MNEQAEGNRAQTYFWPFSLHSKTICLGVAVVLFHPPSTFHHKAALSNIRRCRVHMPLDEPGHRPYYQFTGYYFLYDRVHTHIWLEQSLKTLSHDVIGTFAAKELDYYILYKMGDRRCDSIWCRTVIGLGQFYEEFVTLFALTPLQCILHKCNLLPPQWSTWTSFLWSSSSRQHLCRT